MLDYFTFSILMGFTRLLTSCPPPCSPPRLRLGSFNTFGGWIFFHFQGQDAPADLAIRVQDVPAAPWDARLISLDRQIEERKKQLRQTFWKVVKSLSFLCFPTPTAFSRLTNSPTRDKAQEIFQQHHSTVNQKTRTDSFTSSEDF